MARLSIAALYDRLFQVYGPQGWWPAESSFEVMVGALLTQNTAWRNVERAIAALRSARALTPRRIVKAAPQQLGRWIKSSGCFNVKAGRLQHLCQWYLDQGEHAVLAGLPTALLRPALLAVHGVGQETADAILLYAFNRPVFVIDAYTRRLLYRLGIIYGDEDYEALRGLMQQRLARRRNTTQVYNQYHALIVQHAKTVCKVKPRCNVCCLQRRCQQRLD
ncbi:MAG: endonuclease [Gammaproteobacteria bacterium]|nr:endonuclease [Gammaproteobacteria bacterium]